ncbi:hypothetical protein [Dokdonella sp.]|uniref:hypothetical protein n=1 Tax=Dokdonella sp. TaxID=2291710 RepID=UPI003C3AE244
MTRRLPPEQDLERLFDEDAGEFGAIYGRLSRPEPPRRLDRAILATAARAVRGEHAPRAQRWALAMGSVTGVVLAAGIAWQVGKQMQSRESVPDGSQRTQDTRIVPVEAITEPRPRSKIKSDLIMRDSEAPSESRQLLESQLGQSSQADASSATPEVAAPTAPSIPAAPGMRSSLRKSVVPQDSAAVPQRTEAETFPAQSGNAVDESELLQETSSENAEDLGPRAAGNAVIAESRKSALKRQPAAPAAAPSHPESSLSRNMQLPPQAWLEEIGQLMDGGRRDDAVENLRAFRTLYPDWPLSESLLQLDP